MIKDPSPSQEPPHPLKLHSSGGLLTPPDMMDFYETCNLSLLPSNEHIQNVIMDLSPNKEPPYPPQLQQSLIILLEAS